jgi:hypothetical protein
LKKSLAVEIVLHRAKRQQQPFDLFALLFAKGFDCSELFLGGIRGPPSHPLASSVSLPHVPLLPFSSTSS